MTTRTTRLDRINVQLDAPLRAEVSRFAERIGESVSTFLRQGAAERLERLKRQDLERRLQEAYVAMAAENLATAQDYASADLEGWE